MTVVPGLVVTSQQLQYLVAIDQSATWGDAAAAVGVSPSALSQGIAELERRLGLRLFERDGRRRVPTRDHGEVLRYAEQVVAATGDLDRWLRRRRRGEAGTLRIGMIDAAATHHCRSALRGFRDARADVELRMSVAPSGELLRELRRGRLDVVVCVRPAETPPGVEIEPLLDDPLAVLAPPRVGSGPRPRAADWGPWVTFPEGSHTRAIVAGAVAAAGAPFEVVAESHQPEVLREMVLLDVGWTVLPTAGVPRLDELCVVEPAIASRQLVLARRQNPTPDAAADQLTAALRHVAP